MWTRLLLLDARRAEPFSGWRCGSGAHADATTEGDRAGCRAGTEFKVILGHQHKMEGDRREWAEGLSSGVFNDAYTRTAKESPMMRYAGNQLAPINYILFLDTAINEHGQAMAIIGGLSLMLFPVVVDSDVIVTGTLYEAATGKEVGVTRPRAR